MQVFIHQREQKKQSYMEKLFCTIIVLISILPSAYSEPEDEFFFRRGMELYKSKQYQFAIEDMEKALIANPAHYRAANMLGKIYRQKKLMKKSLDYYLLSLSVNPSQPETHYIVGTLYDYFFSSFNSVRHYLKAIELDPTHRHAHLKLVRYYLLEKKDLTSANRHFQLSFDLGKDDAVPFLKAAEKSYSSGNERDALEHYRIAVKKNPADLDTYFRISEIYVRGREYRKAVRWLEKITYIRPDSEKAYVRLGNLYFTTPLSQNKKFLYDQAITHLKSALEINPSNRDALLLLAEVYRKSGKNEEAEKLFKKVELLEKEIQ